MKWKYLSNEAKEARYQKWVDKISDKTGLDPIRDQFEIDEAATTICNPPVDELEERWDTNHFATDVKMSRDIKQRNQAPGYTYRYERNGKVFSSTLDMIKGE